MCRTLWHLSSAEDTWANEAADAIFGAVRSAIKRHHSDYVSSVLGVVVFVKALPSIFTALYGAALQKSPSPRTSQGQIANFESEPHSRLRLGHWFGMDPRFWLNLQAQFDLVAADSVGDDRIRHLPTRATSLGEPCPG